MKGENKMARPKKVENNSASNTTKSNVKENIKKENSVVEDKTYTELKKENNSLKGEINDIKLMLSQMMASQETISKEEIKTAIIPPNIEHDDIDIRPDKQIKVVSLENNLANLTTQAYGQGKVYRFDKFGQIRNIPYSDLSDIILNNQKFIDDGRFYIDNNDVIYKQGLNDIYTKLLSKNDIENLLKYDKKTIEDKFANTTDVQKEIVAIYYATKISNNEEVDFNKIDILSKLYGKNISEIIVSYNE